MSNSPQPRRNKFNSIEVGEVHSNVYQEVIEVTSDKLKLILLEYVECLAKSKEWQMPLSLILAIILVLSTTSFKQSFGLSPDTWFAIFVISCGLSCVWLLKTLLHKKNSISIDELIQKVKNKT